MICIHCEEKVEQGLIKCPECGKGDFLIGDALPIRKKDKISIICSCKSSKIKLIEKENENLYYEEKYLCTDCNNIFSIKRDKRKIIKKKRDKWILKKPDTENDECTKNSKKEKRKNPRK